MNIAEIILKLQDISDAPYDPDSFALSLVEAYSPPKATLIAACETKLRE
jgi:hypothetical protein